MFKLKGSDEMSELDIEIDRVIRKMSEEQPSSENYAQMAAQLVKLHELKETPSRVNLDTLLTVAGNLLGILLIIGYEQKHVVTTRAKDFILKLR